MGHSRFLNQELVWSEQEADGDPAYNGGYSLTEFPEWFIHGLARPVKDGYTFTTGNYIHDKDTASLSSELLGPVTILTEHWV